MFILRRCFKQAWKTHAQEHSSLPVRARAKDGAGGSPSVMGMTPGGAEEEPRAGETVASGTGEGIAMYDAEAEKRSRSNTVTSTNSVSFFNPEGDEMTEDGEKWTLVSQERVYTPQAADVGCRLRVAVRAIADADQSALAGPVFAFTAPVLSAPAAPPKRSLHTVPGSGAGIAGVPRFRVVSYNILAEQYATSQVRCFRVIDSAASWEYEAASVWVMQSEVILMYGCMCACGCACDAMSRHIHTATRGRWGGRTAASCWSTSWRRSRETSCACRRCRRTTTSSTCTR